MDVVVRACVRSGLCCRTGPCAFGEWDAAAHQCRFLTVEHQGDGFTTFACGKKAEIDALPASRGAQWNPAFGAGCCMPLFNDNRQRILRNKLTNGTSTD